MANNLLYSLVAELSSEVSIKITQIDYDHSLFGSVAALASLNAWCPQYFHFSVGRASLVACLTCYTG